jgi:hypothetical protein
VLVGDSHAGQWFPAFERLAGERAWRLMDLTKSACPSADVAVWIGSLRREYRECDAWRASAIARVAAEQPALVVLSNDRAASLLVRGQRVDATSAPDLWAAGLRQIDPTPMVCTADLRPAVIGRYLVLRDRHHFATPFAASLADRLGAELPRLR